MNYKFQKKPVVIEAFQMTKERRRDNKDWPAWLHEAWNKEHNELGSVQPRNYPNSDGADHLCVVTTEGVMTADWDDWIIQGVEGELYPCKPSVFGKTYEPADA